MVCRFIVGINFIQTSANTKVAKLEIIRKPDVAQEIELTLTSDAARSDAERTSMSIVHLISTMGIQNQTLGVFSETITNPSSETSDGKLTIEGKVI